MPAYVINDMEVTDPELLEEYKRLSPATVARFGGVDADVTYSTGTTNVLFLDGHAEGVDRAKLPGKPDNGFFCMQIIGSTAQMVSPINPGVTGEFIWNAKQQK